MGRHLRKQKKVDYRNAVHKYDRSSFKAPKVIRLKGPLIVTRIPGRGRAAPPATTWPSGAMHTDITYYGDIASDLGWGVPIADVIYLPFKHLDIVGLSFWQGIEQAVPMNGDAEAAQHFETIHATLRMAASNPRITEAVGEAAAAIHVLAAGGWQMVWGFHLHAGTGIDQIWVRSTGIATWDYLIVEAKGPGAGVNISFFVPPNFGQMEAGWVFNHLCSMNNNHALGQTITARLGLSYAVAHANYQGASKSYHSVAPASTHRTSGGHLYGLVVTAQWLADGRLGHVAGPLITYF